ncbi:MAG: hypothetical protein Q9171_002706 [Xanthocarpia ochracea]
MKPISRYMKPSVLKGCYSSADGFLDQGSYTYQSPGYCQEQCVKLNKPVMALVAGSDCGGDNTWSVLLTGLNNNVESAEEASKPNADTDSKDSDPKSNPPPKAAPSPSTSSTSASTTPSPAAKDKPSSDDAAAAAQPDATKDKPPSTITRASTVVVTAPGQTQPISVSVETTQPAKGPNTAGIAAGVVVGVVSVCAVAGGLFFFLRRRKRRALEEEYQQHAVNPFEGETESKPPASSHSMSDSRLEPSVMMQRRQSDGSIADNQDYSRRILKASLGDGSDAHSH